MLLNLNAVMSIIFNVPAAVASTIVASRAVRRLTKFTSKGPEVFAYVCLPRTPCSILTRRLSRTQQRSRLDARVPRHRPDAQRDGHEAEVRRRARPGTSRSAPSPQPRTYSRTSQMDTFTLAEQSPGAHSFLEYDASGKVKGESYDAEAQEISDEFKRPPY